ncbi:hypothetical protein [Fontibacillus sp. BL9]|uniref:hypothetical protein n=1 Tax=Fontibacillus sp. BL9 TaxID=3389971 RepID=UPI00397E84D2
MSDEIKTLDVGLVMPIAHIENCPPEHWIDVKNIIEEALSAIPGYKCNVKIVSEGDSSGLIHKRIVQGLYNSHVVICDVSCKNPNVMFELGMRLAFDKPTIIIKDDQTTYTFDPGGIEHINYPRDLRFNKITEFKTSLAKKVQATYEDFLSDPNHSPFLKSFGEFTVAAIDQTTVSPDALLFQIMEELRYDVANIKRSLSSNQSPKVQKFKLKSEVYKNLNTAVSAFFNTNEGKKGIKVDDISDLTDFVEFYLDLNDLTGKDLPRNQKVELILDLLKSENVI